MTDQKDIQDLQKFLQYASEDEVLKLLEQIKQANPDRIREIEQMHQEYLAKKAKKGWKI